jgi:hypothetical protein
MKYAVERAKDQGDQCFVCLNRDRTDNVLYEVKIQSNSFLMCDFCCAEIGHELIYTTA